MKLILGLCLMIVAAEVKAADLIEMADAQKVFERAYGVSGLAGKFEIGDCEVEYKFGGSKGSYSYLNLSVQTDSGKRSIDYFVSTGSGTGSDAIVPIRNDRQHVIGFEVTQTVGLDCEMQGCLTYVDERLIVKPGFLYVEGRSDYDPIHYASIQSLTCE